MNFTKDEFEKACNTYKKKKNLLSQNSLKSPTLWAIFGFGVLVLIPYIIVLLVKGTKMISEYNPEEGGFNPIFLFIILGIFCAVCIIIPLISILNRAFVSHNCKSAMQKLVTQFGTDLIITVRRQDAEALTAWRARRTDDIDSESTAPERSYYKDSKGILRAPGEPFYDEEGVLHMPEERYNSIPGNDSNDPSL